MAQQKRICTCGKTKNPPYCDHSHESLETPAAKKVLCTCGKTKTPPYCDHSHHSLETPAAKKVLCTCGKTKTPPYCDHSHEGLKACPVKITPVPDKILLLMLPYWDPLIPPQGISQLKTYLQKHGYIIKTGDANAKEEFKRFYNRYFDVFRKYIPEDKQGNFFNIGHEIMRNHMMAHINYENEAEYTELVKTIIYNTFYTHFDDGQVMELKRLLDEFYKLLEDYILHLLKITFLMRHKLYCLFQIPGRLPDLYFLHRFRCLILLSNCRLFHRHRLTSEYHHPLLRHIHLLWLDEQQFFVRSKK